MAIRRRYRPIRVALILLLNVFALMGLVYLYRASKVDFAPTQLDYLILKMEAQYRRQLDSNGYSINYRGRPPDTVVIEVKHYGNVNRNHMNSAIESAKSLVKGLARDEFGLRRVRVEVDVELVSR